MSAERDESALLIAFARAVSKAQEIEALLQEIVIAVEVATDTQNRSLEEIVAKIEKLPFLKMVRIADPLFAQMWEEVNEEQVFLMHKFFNVFPINMNADKLAEATQRLVKIDALLENGRRLLTQVRDRKYVRFNQRQRIQKRDGEQRRS